MGFFSKYIASSQVNTEIIKAYSLKRLYEINGVTKLVFDGEMNYYKPFSIVFDFMNDQCFFNGDLGRLFETLLGDSKFEIIDFFAGNECEAIVLCEQSYVRFRIKFDGNSMIMKDFPLIENLKIKYDSNWITSIKMAD